MYTLKITDENTVVTTVKESIMERSNCVDKIQILTSKMYREQIDMSDASLYMKYKLPISNKIKTVQLIANDLQYKENYIQYLIPAEVALTAESGNIEVTFTVLKPVHNEDDTFTSYIRKTTSGTIYITPLVQFDKYEPSELFSETDQRLLKIEGYIKDLDALNKATYENMPTDIQLDLNDENNKKLTLINQNGNIGNGVAVKNLSSAVEGEIVDADPDGVQDGVIYLDQIVDIDRLLAK